MSRATTARRSCPAPPSRPRAAALPARLPRPLLVLGALAALAAPATAQDWPDLYDADVLLTLHLEMAPADWDALRRDAPADPTNDTYVYTEYPAQLWADGETPILVAVRRKRSRALPSENDPQKVGLKIDVDQYVTLQDWRGVTKLSLENGGEGELLREGIAWTLHDRAGYGSGRGNWMRLVVNGQLAGVYVSAEQPGKRFLKNRAIHVNDQTWLYKHRFDVKVGGPGDSPAVVALCYPPFAASCPTPDADTLAAELPRRVDMEKMLSFGAAGAFLDNADELFSKPNNYYFADWNNGWRRVYYPWDLDTVMGDVTADVHAWGPRAPTDYQEIILGNPAFRAQYDAILAGLLDGAYSPQRLMNLVDLVETTLTAALEEDPLAGLGSVPAAFDDLRLWLCRRVDEVRGQLGIVAPPACSDLELCANGADDDGDLAADCADGDCGDHPACLPESRCLDGIDNDGDGQADCLDPDCLVACFPEADCADGVDDNGNGLTDCADPSCAGDLACPESNCVNGVDDDGDGQTDCDDADCAAACLTETSCTNLLDDDADGLLDCRDPDCLPDPACVVERDCADGLDDDADTAVDCADADCVDDEECQGEWSCSDRLDNDGDTTTDCSDLNCIGDPACPEAQCDDALDNDGDALVDCEDPDCASDGACRDSDADGRVDLLDCAPLDASAFAVPPEAGTLFVREPARTVEARLSWPPLRAAAGTGVTHDVASGLLAALWADRDLRGASCLASDLRDAPSPLHVDVRPPPAPSDGFWYLVRARSACGAGPWGAPSLDAASPCP